MPSTTASSAFHFTVPTALRKGLVFEGIDIERDLCSRPLASESNSLLDKKRALILHFINFLGQFSYSGNLADFSQELLKTWLNLGLRGKLMRTSGTLTFFK